MREFFPTDRLEHFQDFFSIRVLGSFFFSALCVLAGCRNQGIVSQLIELTKSKAKEEGYYTLILIVFDEG